MDFRLTEDQEAIKDAIEGIALQKPPKGVSPSGGSVRQERDR